jgi:hypothetical protein
MMVWVVRRDRGCAIYDGRAVSGNMKYLMKARNALSACRRKRHYSRPLSITRHEPRSREIVSRARGRSGADAGASYAPGGCGAKKGDAFSAQ